MECFETQTLITRNERGSEINYTRLSKHDDGNFKKIEDIK